MNINLHLRAEAAVNQVTNQQQVLCKLSFTLLSPKLCID